MLKATDQFLVFDPDDRFHASLCFGETEAKEIVAHFGATTGLRVLRLTEGEICRDVTDDFLTDDDDLLHDFEPFDRVSARLVTSPHGHSYYRDGRG